MTTRATARPARAQRPFTVRLLRLRHLQPRPWQRALVADGTVVLTLLLVLADLVSAWALVVLPLAVALVVKAHDVVGGQLAGTIRNRGPARVGADRTRSERTPGRPL